jgi:hypothetical protein
MRALSIGVLLGAASAIVLQQLRRRMAVSISRPTSPAAAAPASVPNGVKETGPDDVSSLTAAELYRRAQAAGIRGRATMTKAQLIEALRAANP